jgi:hypothetical protein
MQSRVEPCPRKRNGGVAHKRSCVWGSWGPGVFRPLRCWLHARLASLPSRGTTQTRTAKAWRGWPGCTSSPRARRARRTRPWPSLPRSWRGGPATPPTLPSCTTSSAARASPSRGTRWLRCCVLRWSTVGRAGGVLGVQACWACKRVGRAKYPALHLTPATPSSLLNPSHPAPPSHPPTPTGPPPSHPMLTPMF